MKAHVSHEIRNHRLAGFAMIVSVMSIFAYRTWDFPISHPVFQSQAGNRLNISAAAPVRTELKTEASTVHSSLPAPADVTENSGAALNSMSSVAGTFNAAELLEFAVPETEETLKLEDWMMDADFWASTAEGKGITEATAEVGSVDVHRAEAGTAAGAAIGSPEWVAEKSVIDAEPPLVWTTHVPAFNEWIASGFYGEADESEEETALADLLVGDFDCEAALKSQIRLNEAMVEERDAPLRLESWMLDESLFSPGLKTEVPSVGKAVSENRKIRNRRN